MLGAAAVGTLLRIRSQQSYNPLAKCGHSLIPIRLNILPGAPLADFPRYLASFDDLEAHIQDYFKDLKSTEKGTRFAVFVAQLVPFVPEFRDFGEARLSESLSHDGGVDVVSVPLDDGKRLCIQAKLRVAGKEDIDSIISKFESFERQATTGPGLGTRDLFDASQDQPAPVFGVVTASKIDGILRRYLDSAMSSRRHYDHLVSEQRLHIVDGVKILRILQTAYGRTYNVPSKLTLPIVSPPIRCGTVRLGFLRATSLVELYKQHGDALFFENIRDYLGPTSGRIAPDQPTVNEEIGDTIVNEPGRFLERNNGITFKARLVEEPVGEELTLHEASIVNGCQTTMSLVNANTPLDECLVQVKVIESDDAWDVAKSANFQNTVDKIDLDLARYLRPQVVRQAASEAGVEIENSQTTNAISLLGNFYNDKVQYDEVRHLYIGLMSRSPNNIGDTLYTKLRTDLITAFAETPANQKMLIDTLFRVVLATRTATATCEEMFGEEDYMKPFLRIFHDRKPQYRIFLAILSICAITRVDISARLDDPVRELDRMRDFIAKVADVMARDQAIFVRTYVRAMNVLASEARFTSDDDNRVRQSLSNLLKRAFKSMYASLLMSIDAEEKLSRL